MAQPAETEPQVTVQDLHGKWDEIRHAAQEQVQRRALGVAPVVIAGAAIGAGVLGLAFWLGRRSVRRAEEPPEPAAAVVATAPRPTSSPSTAARVIEPALTSALNALATAGARAAVTALTRRLDQQR